MNDEIPQEAYKQVGIDRIIPNDLPTHFVNDFVIQHQQDYFTLSFFEILHPMILGDTDEEVQEVLDTIENLEAKCKARLIVTPKMVKQILEIISTNLSKYETMYSTSDLEK